MRLLNVLSGGYWRVMDRLIDLQNEAFTLGNAPFANLGVDLVLSGCTVTDNGNGTVNIAPGLIYIGGNTLRFDGQSNVASGGVMAFATGPVVTSTPRPFGDNATKNIYSEQKAVIVAQTPLNLTQIKIDTTLYGVKQYIQDQINQSEVKGTTKDIQDLDGTFAANFDLSGKGVTQRWLGWALDNGNNGTKGTAGMALIGQGVYTDPVSGQQTTYVAGSPVGERMHTLTVAEMPSHNHAQGADVYYTNGSGGSHAAGDSGAGTRGSTSNTGGGAAHNNMQPSMPVYRVVKIV